MPKRYSSRELIRMIEVDGWVLVGVKGDHHQFRHPTKPGRVTIPHPRKDMPAGTANSVLKQAAPNERDSDGTRRFGLEGA